MHKQWALAAMVAAAVGCSSETETVEAESVPSPDPAAETRLSRLSTAQYRNAIVDLFGDSIVLPVQLEPDIAIDGLIAIGNTQTTISARGVEQYETGSYDIAAQTMAAGNVRDSLVACTPSGTTDPSCARASIEALGLRAWRRPLTGAELDVLEDIATDAATTLGDFYVGLEFSVAVLLQSPNFLYRVEVGEPDPNNPNQLRYTDYEMASRLSFFAWNTIPDAELMAAAERGELTTEDGVRLQAERLLSSPRARHALANFFTELFELYELDKLSKDPTVFTHISPELGPDARQETLRVIEDLVFEQGGDYRDLFTTPRTFINRRLASVYNVRAPAREGFAEFVWDKAQPRRGLMTHVSLLALNSHPVSSSATLRGKFVRKVLLCGVIPAPPVDVNTALPEPSGETRTLRERVAEHLTDPGCRGCHINMDPIGLGLENFDALGQFRTLDNDAVIDPSGDLDGDVFADAVDLGRALHDSEDLAPCLVRSMYRYATGHKEEPGEAAMLEGLDRRFEASGYRVLDLMLDVMTSPGFRFAVPASNELEGE